MREGFLIKEQKPFNLKKPDIFCSADRHKPLLGFRQCHKSSYKNRQMFCRNYAKTITHAHIKGLLDCKTRAGSKCHLPTAWTTATDEVQGRRFRGHAGKAKKKCKKSQWHMHSTACCLLQLHPTSICSLQQPSRVLVIKSWLILQNIFSLNPELHY